MNCSSRTTESHTRRTRPTTFFCTSPKDLSVLSEQNHRVNTANGRPSVRLAAQSLRHFRGSTGNIAQTRLCVGSVVRIHRMTLLSKPDSCSLGEATPNSSNFRAWKCRIYFSSSPSKSESYSTSDRTSKQGQNAEGVDLEADEHAIA